MYVGVPGAWKNFEEMEENLCLAELEAMRSSIFDRDTENRRFLAALQGVDLDKNKTDVSDRRKEIEKRAKARRMGVDVNALENMSLEELGFEVTQE